MTLAYFYKKERNNRDINRIDFAMLFLQHRSEMGHDQDLSKFKPKRIEQEVFFLIPTKKGRQNSSQTEFTNFAIALIS